MKKSTLLLVALAALILLLVAARFYFSEADYALQNYGWNGFSQLSSAANVKPLYSIADLPEPGNGDTLLIAAPATNYTSEESTRVLEFLQGGGKVVVMDDFGKADSLLEGLGSPITISPVLLCQYEGYHVNHAFPIVTNVSSSVGKVKKIVLDYPASLNVTGSAEVIAYSSNKSWQDYNANVTLDDDERMGAYPVLARSFDGNGELLVASDPDIFINGMLDLGDNRALLSTMLTGNVWIDVSHGRDVTPLGKVYYIVRYDGHAQAAAALLIMGVLACFVVMHVLRRRRNNSRK